ncbi:hypothetical protein EJ04DRAFT_549694 [Polyplosphaeria fusca]|uniref:Ubiquitin-like protease family profile domain-containing protein n=1 Tax=Polyplosphaeria fusca TaxID=682080 RepID=A0A9P4R9C0_9PLEO|nr:hypothetical protein EJ04DRAFT_549694 [Polyplosphaeria fusca]
MAPDPLEQTYLELPNTSVTLGQTIAITEVGHWLEDSEIGVSFEILSAYLDCDSHRIALINPLEAQNMFILGRDGLKKDEKSIRTAYDQEIEAIKNKDFVFVPINEGYQAHGTEEAGNLYATGDAGGTHWSLLVVDCRKSELSGWHYNTSRDIKGHEKIATTCQAGIVHLLGEVKPVPVLRSGTTISDTKTPCQTENNKSRSDGGGACGPCIWHLAGRLVMLMVDMQERAGNTRDPVSGALVLDSDFMLECNEEISSERQLDSVLYREQMQRLIVECRHLLE